MKETMLLLLANMFATSKDITHSILTRSPSFYIMLHYFDFLFRGVNIALENIYFHSFFLFFSLLHY
jgi:hypothetical protein